MKFAIVYVLELVSLTMVFTLIQSNYNAAVMWMWLSHEQEREATPLNTF